MELIGSTGLAMAGDAGFFLFVLAGSVASILAAVAGVYRRSMTFALVSATFSVLVGLVLLPTGWKLDAPKKAHPDATLDENNLFSCLCVWATSVVFGIGSILLIRHLPARAPQTTSTAPARDGLGPYK